MYEKGDKIMYGNTGVCLVEDIQPMDNSGKLYYKLRPIYGSETIFTPVDTKVFMRPVLTKAEAEELIKNMPETEAKNCKNKSVAAMREEYQKSFASHSTDDLVQLIKGIYEKSKESGKMGSVDEQYMKRAENLLYGELACALGIDRCQVIEYITTAIEK